MPFVGSKRGYVKEPSTLFGYIFGSSNYEGSTTVKQVYAEPGNYFYCNYSIPNSLEEVIISDEETIGYGAFSYCPDIKKITVLSNISSIGSGAFAHCINLSNLAFPSSVISVGANAFYGSDKLPYTTTNDLKYLGSTLNPNFILIGAVDKTKSTYNISSQTKIVMDNAFYQCENLTEILVPAGVTNIGYFAFGECNKISKMTIPFVGNIIDVATNGFLAYIFGGANYQYSSVVSTSLKTVIVTGGTKINSYAFWSIDTITEVVLPSTITTIGNKAFEDCAQLSSINIPEGVKRIELGAFTKCRNLSNLIIPEGIEYIGMYVFYGCSNLTSNCRQASDPGTWDEYWSTGSKAIVWGYAGN